jgi:hypothetical protein
MCETRDINDISAMYTSKIDKTPVLSMNEFFNHNIDNMIRIDIIKDEIKEKTLLGRFLNVILKDNIIDEKNWIKYLCDNLFLLAVLSKDMILIADVVNCGFEIPKNIFSILISKKCFDIKKEKVVQTKCNTRKKSQKWNYKNKHRISVKNKKCLDVMGGHYNNGSMIVYPCHKGSNQQFK